MEVTAYEYKLLEYLMLHAGMVISKTTLTEHLYQEDEDRDSNVLEVLVGRLRRSSTRIGRSTRSRRCAVAATDSPWNGLPAEMRSPAAACAPPPAWCWLPSSA